jgi:hypothetical protein
MEITPKDPYFYGIVRYVVPPPSPPFLHNVKLALHYREYSTSTGKALARLARLALMAEELEERELQSHILCV